MATQQLIGTEKLAIVRLTKDDSHLHIGFWLGEEFTGGELVHLAPGARIAVEGADPLSSTYSRTNWMGGLASGALYAFRTLHLPRQRLLLTELSGRLQSCDMEAVASGAALGIARLANQELAQVPTSGWHAEVQLGAHLPLHGPVAGVASHVAPVASATPAPARENHGVIEDNGGVNNRNPAVELGPTARRPGD